MREKLIKIFANFQVEGDVVAIEQIKNGHINDSFRVIVNNAKIQNWFLQRINPKIFRNIDGLMNNMDLVTQHLHRNDNTGNDDSRQCLRIIRTRNSELYHIDEKGYSWRLLNFVEDNVVYDVVKDYTIAFEGGRAFGRFVVEMAGLDPSKLSITIPRFHDFGYRWEQFTDVLLIKGNSKVTTAANEISFVEKRYNDIKAFYSQVENGLFPVRITHNDTKFNNIMFNKKGQAICIIDLDTVMPGSVLFDFGDAIRTATNTASEDETDLNKVNFDLDLYEAYTNGYLKECASTLTEIEIMNLSESARYMTFIIGLRFLTDYLAGDVYYKTSRPRQNLDRAKVQFHMVECLENKMPVMKKIANSHLKIMNA